jgi:hypothetical protein
VRKSALGPRVGLQDRSQMRFAVDQYPVRALGQDGSYPAFGITVRPGSPRRLRKIVSTVKKSQASSPSAWTRRKVRQEVSRPRGAGRQPLARRIRRTVGLADALAEPGQLAVHPAVSPREVLPASRSTMARISALVPGRPCHPGYVYLLDQTAMPG